MISVVVNGKTEQLAAGTTLAGLVAKYDLAPQRVACEVNQDLVPRRNYDATTLKDGDHIEIVTFVGGG
jgi:sulfur carrier protein